MKKSAEYLDVEFEDVMEQLYAEGVDGLIFIHGALNVDFRQQVIGPVGFGIMQFIDPRRCQDVLQHPSLNPEFTRICYHNI